MTRRFVSWAITSLLFATAAACGSPTSPVTPLVPAAPSPTPDIPLINYTIQLGYTHHRADGNRVVDGKGPFPGGTVLDIPIDGSPSWVVGTAVDGQTFWAVVNENGDLQAFLVSALGTVQDADKKPDRLPPGMPPLLRLDKDVASLANSQIGGPSPFTHPVVLTSTARVVSVDDDGDVVIRTGPYQARLGIDALPDARLVIDEQERVLVLTRPTGRLPHGVLGDTTEAEGVTLIDTRGGGKVAASFQIEDNAVIEGIAPIWTDLTGDGQREIIMTVSDARVGARVVVFSESGQRVAAGPPVGQGSRWRHQLAVAPFGPNGETEIAEVLTPHIGGVVGFYRLDGDSLEIVAQLPGFSTHVLGSRNLDMALAGDMDGDGRIELLVPTQDMTELAGIRRTGSGAAVAWTVPVGGTLTTNLAAIDLGDGRFAVAAGSDENLRVWLPGD